jgi:hypothetical protein
VFDSLQNAGETVSMQDRKQNKAHPPFLRVNLFITYPQDFETLTPPNMRKPVAH